MFKDTKLPSKNMLDDLATVRALLHMLVDQQGGTVLLAPTVVQLQKAYVADPLAIVGTLTYMVQENGILLTTRELQ